MVFTEMYPVHGVTLIPSLPHWLLKAYGELWFIDLSCSVASTDTYL